MLGTTEKEGLTIDELDSETRKEAFAHLREILWDPRWFEETLFKSILEEEGFPTGKIYWSLGYVQGDGVSWYGTVDVEKFLRKNRIWTRYKDLEPFAAVSISGESVRGPGSMEVELELTGGWESFVPAPLAQKMEEWDRQETRRWSEIEQARRAWAAGVPTGVKEWRPLRGPQPTYQPQELPAWYQEGLNQAEANQVAFEAHAKDLKETIQSRTNELSRELQRVGYAEIEYQESEVFLRDMIEANDYRFGEEGHLVRRN